MRKTGKPVFFVVLALVLALTALTFLGVSVQNGDIRETYIKSAEDIRWGIDIRGGVDVTFSPPEGYDATPEEMNDAKEVIESRLINQNIADYEVYVDNSRDRVIVRFPWKEDETDFNPEKAIQELGETAMLTFREGHEIDAATGMPAGVTAETVILEGRDVVRAQAVVNQGQNGAGAEPAVSLTLSSEGVQKFSEATGRLVGQTISIWMDDELLSYPMVNQQITDGNAIITGSFTSEQAKDLAAKITSGALPFRLTTENYSTISPTLGMGAKDAMVLAGAIAFVLVCIFMIFIYRVPGFVACITLLGQITLIIASTTGFFGGLSSFTLTLPGIAGIVLSIGFGVDAVVISAERIKEELYNGKTIDGAIELGYKRAFSAILDGNVTIIIVAIILMGAFGPPNSLFGAAFSKIFFMFGPSTAGNIYSFGYTLLMGVLFNLVMGVFASKLLVKSLSKFKAMRRPWLFGGRRPGNNESKMREFRFDYNKNFKKYLAISGTMIAVILVAAAVFGVGLDIQFRGGSMITYSYEGELDRGSFQSVMDDEMGGVSVQYSTDLATGTETAVVSLPGDTSISADELGSVNARLASEFAGNNLQTAEITNVDATIGREFLAKCLCALAVTTVLMLIYVAWRFARIGGLSAGAMGIVALLHDCMAVFGVFVLFRIPLNGNFIAAMLTILGYSLNDTIVIYDRIRENKRIYAGKKPIGELVNLSVNQSLTRSINTSVTTIMSMVVVTVVAAIFNVESIFSFAFPLIIGLISGTYSTVCLAGPLWVKWQEHKLVKKA